jgi:glycosyltransferase involved in cell wall biosynthesis
VRLVRQTGRGKGNALRAGFEACTGDIIVMIDADGSMMGSEVPRFVAALANGADVVKGSRYLSGGGSADFTRFRRLGNTAIVGIVNTLFRTSYTDVCYGYLAFWTHHLPVVAPDCEGFEVETLMNIRPARAGLRVVEVPSYESPRMHGVSKLNTVRDGANILRLILRERVKPDHGTPSEDLARA